MVNKKEEPTLIKLRDIESKFGKLIPLKELEAIASNNVDKEVDKKNVESLIKKKILYEPLKGHVSFNIKPRRRDDIIEAEFLNCQIKHKSVEEPSRIFCDKIEYMHNKLKGMFDHHLMFWYKGNLVFKVWLPNKSKDKEFKDVFEAMKICGIKSWVNE